ncbi:MAG TPA: hypothetical protein VGP58_15630, partial [Pyrinomonadaceae bacterium]|nr:hypothetical protein [Pyrinomonadaceae bacterium]
EIGTLEAGKQADVIVISLGNIAQIPIHDVYSALLFTSNARDVKITMVAGEEICSNGLANRIDEAKIKAEMKAVAEKMRR